MTETRKSKSKKLSSTETKAKDLLGMNIKCGSRKPYEVFFVML